MEYDIIVANIKEILKTVNLSWILDKGVFDSIILLKYVTNQLNDLTKNRFAQMGISENLVTYLK